MACWYDGITSQDLWLVASAMQIGVGCILQHLPVRASKPHLQASLARWNAQVCKAVSVQLPSLAFVQTKSHALLRQLLAETAYPGKDKQACT